MQMVEVGAQPLKSEAPTNLIKFKGMIEMETIEKTVWTSKPALEKMINATAGKIGKPIKIEKADQTQKTFAKVWAKTQKEQTH